VNDEGVGEMFEEAAVWQKVSTKKGGPRFRRRPFRRIEPAPRLVAVRRRPLFDVSALRLKFGQVDASSVECGRHLLALRALLLPSLLCRFLGGRLGLCLLRHAALLV
jgi:hypothetical protein